MAPRLPPNQKAHDMATYDISVPDNKVSDIEAAFKGGFPIPTDDNRAALFSEADWVGECLCRYIRDTDAKYRQAAAQRLISYTPDDSIAIVVAAPGADIA